MTAAPSSNSFQSSVSHQVSMGRDRKKLAGSDGVCVSSSRRAFANLLWTAFPSPSEHDLAHRASKVLECSPRQVVNWLRCQNSAPVHVFFAVAAIAGAEIVLRDRGPS